MDDAEQVIVVGGGLAGLTASIAALEAGAARLLLLESESQLAGAGGRAEVSRVLADDVEDDCNRSDDESEAFQWLLDKLDVSNPKSIAADGTEHAPIGVCFLRRLAEILETSYGSRLRILTSTTVTELLISSDGSCCGCGFVERGKGASKAYGSVLLCCGGFAGDVSPASILATLRPDLLHIPFAFGISSCLPNSGLALAQAAGAATENLSQIEVYPTAFMAASCRRHLAAPALRKAGGILIDESGDTLDETDLVQSSWRCRGEVRLVLDEEVASNPVAAWHCKRNLELGYMEHYSSSAMLAKEMSISESKLNSALHLSKRRRAITAAAANVDDQSESEREPSSSSTSPAQMNGDHKAAEGLWAARVMPVILCCKGGLQVSDNGGVINDKNQPIDGLFAAGEVASSPTNTSSLLSCVASALTAGKFATASSKLRGGSLRDCRAVRPQESPCSYTNAVTKALESVSVKKHFQISTAERKFEKLLESQITAAGLQQALAQAHKQDGNLQVAVEELLSGLLKQTVLSNEGEVCVAMRDKSAAGVLPTPKVRVGIPEAAQVEEALMSCVHCRLPLALEVRARSEEVATELANGSSEGVQHSLGNEAVETPGLGRDGGPFAYATLLYGSTAEYFLGALVLGWSLHEHGCQEDKLLLHTEDVPDPFLEALRQYWKLRQVNALNAVQTLYEDFDKSRFKGVFTKLQVLSVTDYRKVLMMDLDMLVRGNLDELFKLRTPAALKRCSGREQPEHGGDVFAEDMWYAQRDGMCSGINAGVMLLEPDQQVYDRMVAEIQDFGHPEHLGTTGPEQDYLARFYTTFGRAAWSHIHAKYNYQPLLPADYVGKAHRDLDVINDVFVAHYSGPKVKPWKMEGVELNAGGVQRLLQGGEMREFFPAIHATSGRNYNSSRTMVMDGVPVVLNGSSYSLPAEVEEVMWAWVLALRQCNNDLYEAGIDIVTLLRAAEPVRVS